MPKFTTANRGTERCNRCIGRGYIPEPRRGKPGFYARTCPRCGGGAEVPAGSRNPQPRQKPACNPGA